MEVDTDKIYDEFRAQGMSNSEAFYATLGKALMQNMKKSELTAENNKP